jgi:hypothetical protein
MRLPGGHLLLLHLLLLLLAASMVQADPIDPYADGIGIYFDSGATQFCKTWSGGMVSAYLVLTNITEPSGVSGFECKLGYQVPAGSYLLNATLPPNAINADSAPGYLVGLATPLPWSPAVVVLTLNMLETQGNAWVFKVLPNDTPSLPGIPAYAAGGNPSVLIPLRQSSGHADVPVAFMNAPCLPDPCTEAMEVAAFTPGAGTDFTMAADMLGPPDGNAVSLGLFGSVVLELPFAIVDGVGPDFRVFERGVGDGEVDENFRVEASANGLDFVQVGEGSGGTVEFDIFGIGIADPVYVRITDLAPQEPGNPPFRLGADIDALEIIRCGDRNCPHGEILPACRTIEFSGRLFGERYSFDAGEIQLPAGQPFFYDSTRVTVTRGEGDAFYLTGGAGVLAEWICDEAVYIDGVFVPPIGYSYIKEPSFPLCVPMDSIVTGVPARDISAYIPMGTTCIDFHLADTFRGVFGNSEIYLLKESLVPALLSYFRIRPQGGSVTVTWKTSSEIAADRFVLMGRHEGQEWIVAHTLAADGDFTATDESPPLASGGDVVYSLYLSQDGQETLLRSETVSLDGLPAATGLLGVYPNPFNPRTSISFAVRRPQRVEVSLYDMTGRWVATLADRTYRAGTHFLEWDGKDASGRGVSSGAYVLRLVSTEGVCTRKIMLLR